MKETHQISPFEFVRWMLTELFGTKATGRRLQRQRIRQYLAAKQCGDRPFHRCKINGGMSCKWTGI